jgi:hypothetical protein
LILRYLPIISGKINRLLNFFDDVEDATLVVLGMTPEDLAKGKLRACGKCCKSRRHNLFCWQLTKSQPFVISCVPRIAFKAADIAVDFKGQAEHETAINVLNGKLVMRINPTFYRPAEVDLLIGDSTLAKEKLGWVAKTSVEQLSRMMVEADLRRHTGGVSF